MKPAAAKKSSFFRFLGYAALALVVFLFGLWIFFPYGEVERRAEAELSKKGIEAEITGLGPRTPLSYKIKSVHVTRAMGKETNLTVSDAVVGLSLGPILDGRVGLTVTGTFMGGEISADAVVPAPEKVNVSWKEMEIAPLTSLFSEKEIPVGGKMAGTATVVLPYEGPAKLDATVDTEVTGASFGPYSALGFAINPIGLGSGRIRAEAVKGRVRIFDTAFTGGDIAVHADGSVQLAQALASSRIEASAELKPSKQFENDYFMILSLLAPYKNQSGGFNLNIGGTVGSPTVRPR